MQIPPPSQAAVDRAIRMQNYTRHIARLYESNPRSRGVFSELKRFRVFKRHRNAGAHTTMTLWDFWPLEFAIFNLLQAADHEVPDNYDVEHYRYQPLNHLFQMLFEIEHRDRTLFQAYVLDIAGTLAGISGSLSAISSELFMQTNVVWEPSLIAYRKVTANERQADLHLIGGSLDARVEVKNIENQDGYSFDQHLYFARGIDTSRDVLDRILADESSILVTVTAPERILINDQGASFRQALERALSGSERRPVAMVVDKTFTLPTSAFEVKRKHVGSSDSKHSYKTVVNPEGGTGVVFALPFIGSDLKVKVANLCREAVKKQIGDYKAVICLVYDFASIASIKTQDDLDQWKAGVDLLHLSMYESARARSATFRERCNNFMGFALLPPVPFLCEQPLLQFFEQLADGGADQITANLIGSRAQLVEHIGPEAYMAHYQGIIDRYGYGKPDDEPS